MRITGAVVACALLATACGAGGEPGDEPAPPGLSLARRALTGIEDPSVDFSEPVGGAWRPPFEPANERCATLFDLAEGKPWRSPAEVAEIATYHGYHLGETAGVVVTAYPAGEARRALREAAGLMRGCPVAAVKAAVKKAGGGDRLVASPLTVKAGDGAEARRFRGRVGGYPYEMHLVVMRSGDMLVSLVHTGLARLDAGRTQKLAAAVAARVRADGQ
ncbi:hypothetical protein Sru01_33410 [Sphaerisporangium rufum]|uniref:PknH-like extracellular domain-containing protein n=1 Tax=Sphaerisporangium rufum TaxID=1381558 RepID=A0A919V030_9ACTN|nr:hypothetical protein [Sphaerisporangium rufum]GII78359.1 hypothetical protein Sru01_33410 [Sphaerisporangium rufum]